MISTALEIKDGDTVIKKKLPYQFATKNLP